MTKNALDEFTPRELRQLRALKTPYGIQRFLDSLPYHCDGIFVPSAWVPALLSYEVLEDAAWCTLSDHNPVVADFQWRSSPPPGSKHK